MEKGNKMKKYNIAVVPHDGISKYTYPLTVEIIKKASSLVGGFDLNFEYYDLEYAVNHETSEKENILEALKAADAIFTSPCGRCNTEMSETDCPEFKQDSVSSLFSSVLKNNIGLRPLKLMRGIESHLKKYDSIDVMLIRQLSEGGYMLPGSIVSDMAAYDVRIVTRKVTEKLAETAFKIARDRNGRLADGRKSVTSEIKPNCFTTLEFYRKIFTEVGKRYSDIELEFTEIDALTEHLIKVPQRLDVIVCENEHGDIVGNVGTFLTGGTEVTPTADIGGITPIFRPCSPSCTSFVKDCGQNFANPIAAINTASLLLDTIGREHEDADMRKAGALISSAVEYNLLNGGPKTGDMGGCATTEETANGIFQALSKVKR